MSSLIPPENRNASSSASPITISPPWRAWRMLSMPSRSAVPGATISSALTIRESCRDSSSSLSSSPERCGITRFYWLLVNGLVALDAAHHVYEHVRCPQADASVATEHRQHQRKTVAVKPGHDPAGRHQLGARDERLHLHEQRAGAFHRAQYDAPRRPRGPGHEPGRRVQHLDQAVVVHLEHSRLVGAAEAVLDRPHGSVGALAFALELKDA